MTERKLSSYPAGVRRAFAKARAARDERLAAIHAAANAREVPIEDAETLAGIELACAVADWYASACASGFALPATGHAALEALEAVTRPSALRKVRP